MRNHGKSYNSMKE